MAEDKCILDPQRDCIGKEEAAKLAMRIEALERWVQPSGSHDAYNTGDIVRYNGVLYRSKIDGNTWAPDAYPDGWEVVPE